MTIRGDIPKDRSGHRNPLHLLDRILRTIGLDGLGRDHVTSWPDLHHYVTTWPDLHRREREELIATEKAAQAEAAYDVDYAEWALRQSALVADGRDDELDRENLIEEIRSIRQREIRCATRHLGEALASLLVAQAAGAVEHRRRLLEAAMGASRDAAAVFRDSPSLLREPATGILEAAWSQARLDAARSLDCAVAAWPETCPWSLGDLLDRDAAQPGERGVWDAFFDAPGIDLPDPRQGKTH